MGGTPANISHQVIAYSPAQPSLAKRLTIAKGRRINSRTAPSRARDEAIGSLTSPAVEAEFVDPLACQVVQHAFDRTTPLLRTTECVVSRR